MAQRERCAVAMWGCINVRIHDSEQKIEHKRNIYIFYDASYVITYVNEFLSESYKISNFD